MALTPRASIGDCVGQICRYWCWSVLTMTGYISLHDTVFVEIYPQLFPTSVFFVTLSGLALSLALFPLSCQWFLLPLVFFFSVSVFDCVRSIDHTKSWSRSNQTVTRQSHFFYIKSLFDKKCDRQAASVVCCCPYWHVRPHRSALPLSPSPLPHVSDRVLSSSSPTSFLL